MSAFIVSMVRRRCRTAIAILLLILGVGAQPKGVAQSLAAEPQARKEVEQLLLQVQELTEKGNYDAAVPLAESALAVAEKGLQPDDLYTADALTRLAYLYAQKGAYEKAEQCYRRALAIGEKRLGPDHLAVVSTLGYFGELYVDQKDYAQAEELYKRALSKVEAKTEPEAEGIRGDLTHRLADLYYHTDEHDKAEPLYRRALALREKMYGAEHPAVAAILHRLARLCHEKDKPAEAESFALRALTIVEKAPTRKHPNAARLLALLAEIYIKKKDYDRADSSLQRALPLIEKEYVENPAGVPFAAILRGFADKYKTAGQYDRAEPLYRRALAVVEKSGRPQYPDVALYLDALAELHDEKSDYDRAEQLYRRALGIAENAVGPEHKDVAAHLDKLARLYGKKGEHDRSAELSRRALAIREKALGPEHISVAYTLADLAWVHIRKYEYEKAEPLFKRALSISEKVLRPEHPGVVFALKNLAYVYDLMGDYDRAESLYKRALASGEKEFGEDHPKLAQTLNSLAYMFRKKKEYEKAEQLYQRALSIQERALGPKHTDVALTLDWLAWMYDERGDYGKAETLFQRALSIREGALGKEHSEVASSLTTLAIVYDDRGDYEKAEQLYRRALAIREKALGSEHPDVADTLDSLAWIYRERNDYATAEALSKRALKIIESKLGPDHPHLNSVLNLLALVYKGQGDFGRAEPLFQRALRIAEKSYGPNSTSVSQSLHNLSILYIAKGEYEKAEPLLMRALAIREKALGPTHPGVAEDLTSVAYLYAAKGDYPRAVEALTRGTEISERHIAGLLTVGTEEQKHAFMAMQTVANETHGAVALHVQMAPDDPRAVRLALTTLLRRKGRVLEAVGDSLRSLRHRSAPEDRALLDQLMSVRTRLAALALRGNDKIDRAKYHAEMATLEAEAQRLEATVSARSAELRAELQPVTPEAVQKALPPGAALVEIVSYRPFNLRHKKDSGMWGGWHYAAYVLRHEGAPSWADLGEAAAMDGAVSRLRAALGDPQRGDVKELARALDERLMRPVRKLLGGARHVFVSPDGALNLLPFGALVDEQGRYLVESYSITYLTSGHDLLRLLPIGESKQPPVIVANPLFDLPRTDGRPQSEFGREGGGGRRSADMNKVKFGPLPGTAEEAKALGALLPQAKVLTGDKATEAALKQVAAPSILHVATHGFFFADQTREMKEATRGLKLSANGGSSPTARKVENPLLRSGLALAGANALRGEAGEDGVLTALEAAGLDLWGTELVVLSACETGVGDVQNGDGVYGLRRALVLAGSRSQVMSLWQVSDEATRDLMVAYYKRLQAGEGRAEALRAVQLHVLRDEGLGEGRASNSLGGQSVADEGDRGHPYYWAAFIQSGDWRSMRSGVRAR